MCSTPVPSLICVEVGLACETNFAELILCSSSLSIVSSPDPTLSRGKWSADYGCAGSAI